MPQKRENAALQCGMNRPRIYLDNAATSFPKPRCVHDAMMTYATALGASPGRGGYEEAVATGQLLNACRENVSRLVNGPPSENIVFTLNASDALNLAIKGVAMTWLLRDEPVHIIATELEHNSVLRPLNALRAHGVETTLIPADPMTGVLAPEAFRRAIRGDTRLIISIHGSNVTGAIVDVASVGRIAREASIPFLVDAAQTLGHVPIDMDRMFIDLLAFPGHKGLLGPSGTGGLVIRSGFEDLLTPLREGGTGSASEADIQPAFLPDRFEPGSHNMVGIAGLNASLEWLIDRGIEDLARSERAMIEQMIEGLQSIDGLAYFGSSDATNRCAVFSLRVPGMTPDTLATHLEQEHGVLGRAGLHCAPRIHRLLGTADGGGTLRLSLGPFTTRDDVSHAIGALRSVVELPIGV